MKKFITVAALFAAGTALASAATWTWTGTTGELDLSDWTDTSNWTSEDSTETPWGTTTNSEGVVGYGPWGTVNFSTAGTYTFSGLTGGSPQIQMWSSALNVTNGADVTLTIYKIQEVNSLYVDANSSLDITTTVFNGEYTNFTVNVDGTLKYAHSSGSNMPENASPSYTFNIGVLGTLELSLNGEGSSTNRPTSFEDATFNKTVDLSAGTEQIQTATILTITSGSWDSGSTVNVSASDGTAMTAKDSVEDLAAVGDYFVSVANGVVSVTYFSTIPEPSAFGLLAGAGALALVAARRRRSRKAA